ncbi:recombination regulator RecX [Oceanobacillus polygoni]|uniref:Regulatory protein RecX n=1 Tax=Oceanobacillus polygoni TaxID=1235259 RepID=A0A9X0YTQ9_9BACI|nr:recombination regulator RecX [Oceanobacillus polygoni]MBP2078690.1 regulatory protein [Oceanobacillus polygoni]
MRKITRITTQKKNKSRFNIFLDAKQGEEYGFSVDEAILIEYRLRKGMELDDEMIATLVENDTVHKSYTQVIHFLSYRMRTKKEIIDYLVKKEVDPEHIEQIMKRLVEEKLIDDQQFAHFFVQSRINTTTKGPVLIKKELMEKGVLAQQAELALENYSLDTQLEKIVKHIQKKLNTGKKEAFRKKVQQLQANLIQKGFTQDAITKALASMENETDQSKEWDALIFQGEKLLRKYQTKHEGFALRQKMTEALYRKGFSFELINQFLDEQRQN